MPPAGAAIAAAVTSLSSLCLRLLLKHNKHKARTNPMTTRPTTTNVPATAPLLLKNALAESDDELPVSRAPVGLWTICVTV